MPCHDGREQQDRIDSERRRNALAAILCGFMRDDIQARLYATAWCEKHHAIDALRAGVKYDWENPAIGQLKQQSDAILDEAYTALCE